MQISLFHIENVNYTYRPDISHAWHSHSQDLSILHLPTERRSNRNVSQIAAEIPAEFSRGTGGCDVNDAFHFSYLVFFSPLDASYGMNELYMYSAPKMNR